MDRPQFSLRAIFAGTAIFAASLAVLVPEATAVSAIGAVCLAMGLPAMTIAASAATRGYRRSFFVGASAPAVAGAIFATESLLYMRSNDFEAIGLVAVDNSYRIVFSVLWGMAPASGLAGMAAHWLAASPNDAPDRG